MYSMFNESSRDMEELKKLVRHMSETVDSLRSLSTNEMSPGSTMPGINRFVKDERAHGLPPGTYMLAMAFKKLETILSVHKVAKFSQAQIQVKTRNDELIAFFEETIANFKKKFPICNHPNFLMVGSRRKRTTKTDYNEIVDGEIKQQKKRRKLPTKK